MLRQSGAEWEVKGPLCEGWPINHMIGDAQGSNIWAAGGGDWHGAGVWRSADGGESWQLSKISKGEIDDWGTADPEEAGLYGWTDAPIPFTGRFKQVWSLCHSHGTLYAGTKPGALLASTNQGQDWQLVEGLSHHPSAQDWNPGAVGVILHTIVPDPHSPLRFWVAISAAGVFATEDGGKTFERRNRLSNANAACDHPHPAAPRDGETGHCVHHMKLAPGERDLLYQQNHHGVWRSRDGGRSWDDVTQGLPSTFGFPLQTHPIDPQTIFTIPLNGDGIGRYPIDAAAAVYVSKDGGESWQAKRQGLPQKNCYFTVLRQAMAGSQSGIFFGTNTGSLFASLDDGESWQEVAQHLPTILSVEVAGSSQS